MNRIGRDVVLVIAVAVIALFANLGAVRLWDRDEPRNAGAAREMLARGDWITPVFNDQLRKAKPVLIYWLIMSAYGVFGESEFAARFWSATLGVGTAVLTYAIGRRIFDEKTGRWGGVILATSLMFDVAGRAATPDSILIFLSTAAIASFVLEAFAGRDQLREEVGIQRPVPLRTAVLVFFWMGVAVLAKGPVGVVVPTAVIGMFLLIMRLPISSAPTIDDFDKSNVGVLSRVRTSLIAATRPFLPVHFLKTCWAMRPVTAIVVVSLVALPWYIAVGIRTDGEWVRSFLLDENIGRAMQPLENHRGPIFYYLIAVMIGFFPWSIFLVPTVLDAVREARQRRSMSPSYLILFCWVGVYLGIFSLAQTKLPSYVTPMYPALALLTGRFIERWRENSSLVSDLWPRVSLAILGGVGIALLIAIPVLSSKLLPGEGWLGLVGLAPLSGAAVAWWSLGKGERTRACQTIRASAVLFSFLIFGVVLVRVDRHQRSHELWETMVERTSADNGTPEIGSFGCLEPSWVFYGRRPIRELSLDENDQDSLVRFLSDQDKYVITTKRTWETLHDSIEGDYVTVAEVPYFLKRDSLVVVTRAANASTARAAPLRDEGRR